MNKIDKETKFETIKIETIKPSSLTRSFYTIGYVDQL